MRAARNIAALGFLSICTFPAFAATHLEVHQFGALCDGDESHAGIDTAAFASMISKAGTGGAVSVDRGTCIVSGVIMNVPGQTLLVKPNATIKLKAGVASNVITVAADNITIGGHGVIDGNRAKVKSSQGIFVGPRSHVRISDLAIRDTKGFGIYSTDTQYLEVLGTHISGTSTIAIFEEILGNSNIRGLRFENNSVNRSSEGKSITEGGIKIHGKSAYHYKSPKIINNRVIMPESPGSVAAIAIEIWHSDNATIKNNVTFGGAMGLSVADVFDSSIGPLSVTRPSVYGLELAHSLRNTVSNVSIVGGNLTKRGIMLDTTSKGGSTGNVLNDPKITGFTAIGISADKADGLKISNPDFVCGSRGTYSIDLTSTKNFAISGGVLDGRNICRKGVMLNSSWGGTISGVSIRNFKENGVLLYATSPVTFANTSITGNRFTNVNVPFGKQLSGGATLGSRITLQKNRGVKDSVTP